MQGLSLFYIDINQIIHKIINFFNKIDNCTHWLMIYIIDINRYKNMDPDIYQIMVLDEAELNECRQVESISPRCTHKEFCNMAVMSIPITFTLFIVFVIVGSFYTHLICN